MKEIIINKTDKGQRFDKFLMKYFSKANSGFIYKMLRKKNITLNNKKADGTEKLNDGDVVKVFFSDDTFAKFATNSNNEQFATSSNKQSKTTSSLYSKYIKIYNKINNENINVEIIKELDDIIFLNKPAGLLSQAAEKDDLSLNDWLIGYLLTHNNNVDFSRYKPSICNRLDRNTSGIVICAKTYIGSRVITELIREHKLKKFYQAVVEGDISHAFEKNTSKHKEIIELFGYLHKNELTNKVFIYQNETEIPPAHKKDAKLIHTKYKCICSSQSYSLIEIELVTGKSHQIRAHLSSEGYPLAGDIKYGGSVCLGKRFQFLHASRIEFPLIKDDEIGISNLVVESNVPDYFNAALKRACF